MRGRWASTHRLPVRRTLLLLACTLTCTIFLTKSANVLAQDQTNASASDQETEINKKLSNPISTIWALQFQQNTYFIHPGFEDKSSRNSVNLQFQPVLPISLTDDWTRSLPKRHPRN